MDLQRRRYVRWTAVACAAVAALATFNGAAAASDDEPAEGTCFGLTVTIRGTKHGDVIHGTPGDDVIAGDRGPDQIFGGEGNDTICGEAGNDKLFGEAGNDQLDGGTGVRAFSHPGGDNLDGGLGDDTIEGGDRGDHDDLRFATATGGLTVDLETGLATGPGIGTDHLSGIDHVYGTEFHDKIIGSYYVDAGAGADVVLRGRVIHGQAGDDRMSVTPGLGGFIKGGNGDDRGRNATTQYGNSGNDVLIGGPGFDQLYGDDGDDVLRGKGSTDRLDGNLGSDTLRGGPDRDEVTFIWEKGGVVVDGHAGTATTPSGLDTIRGVESIFTTVYADVVRGIDFVDSSNGNDEVRGAHFVNAGQGNDILVSRRHGSELHGSSGDDVIRGRDGPDLLFGDTGNDQIYGNDADDTLSGGDGDDYLDGGTRTDTGDGGLGTDTCVAIETAYDCELDP